MCQTFLDIYSGIFCYFSFKTLHGYWIVRLDLPWYFSIWRLLGIHKKSLNNRIQKTDLTIIVSNYVSVPLCNIFLASLRDMSLWNKYRACLGMTYPYYDKRHPGTHILQTVFEKQCTIPNIYIMYIPGTWTGRSSVSCAAGPEVLQTFPSVRKEIKFISPIYRF